VRLDNATILVGLGQIASGVITRILVSLQMLRPFVGPSIASIVLAYPISG
jgi:hypothetical protein